MLISVKYLIIMIVVLTIIILFIFLLYRTYINKILNEKRLRHEQEINYQKEITRQSSIVQENERKRIAQLLHDDVGSKLNILSVWLNNDETWNSKRSRDVVTQQIPEIINTTRNISHALYPVNFEQFGLILSLEELISNIDSSIVVRLIINHSYHKKDIIFEVQIYRIVQEFISNVIKHSQATEMSIQIRDTKRSFTIILSDNGIGFNTSLLRKGMGLKNIETRIRSINAIYKWKSKINNGCNLIIVCPNNE